MITLVITTFYKVCKSKTNVTVCFYILFNELGIMFSFTLKGAVIRATFLFNLSRNIVASQVASELLPVLLPRAQLVSQQISVL